DRALRHRRRETGPEDQRAVGEDGIGNLVALDPGEPRENEGEGHHKRHGLKHGPRHAEYCLLVLSPDVSLGEAEYQVRVPGQITEVAHLRAFSLVKIVRVAGCSGITPLSARHYSRTLARLSVVKLRLGSSFTGVRRLIQGIFPFVGPRTVYHNC